MHEEMKVNASLLKYRFSQVAYTGYTSSFRAHASGY